MRNCRASAKAYKISELIGDAYGGEWARESFAKWGINYRLSDKNRSELYLAFLPVLMSRPGRAARPSALGESVVQFGTAHGSQRTRQRSTIRSAGMTTLRTRFAAR